MTASSGAVSTPASGGEFRLWAPGAPLAAWSDLTPRLASWDRRDHPSQRRLQEFLDELAGRCAPLDAEQDLWLRLDVDRQLEDSRFSGYDLENYLTPMVHRLGSSRFLLVTAEKRTGGGHRITIGRAVPADPDQRLEGWSSFRATLHGSTSKSSWKADLHAALAASAPAPLPEGPVAVQLAWRCSPRRNWVALWKPTGDAMGPVLGEDPRRPFNPRDDRITSLALHLDPEPALGWSVEVSMWWRSLAASHPDPRHSGT